MLPTQPTVPVVPVVVVVALEQVPEGLDAGVTTLAEILQSAGIPVETTERIKSKLWSKNLINCSLNPLSAITGVTYGELKQPDSWQIIEEMARESFAVARREGISLPWGEPEQFLGYLNGALIPVMAGHRSSMLQDIQHGLAFGCRIRLVQLQVEGGINIPNQAK